MHKRHTSLPREDYGWQCRVVNRITLLHSSTCYTVWDNDGGIKWYCMWYHKDVSPLQDSV